MTLEHLGLTEGLSLPFFFILTKIDVALEKKKEQTKKRVEKAMSNDRFKKQVVFVSERKDVDAINMKNIESGFTVPVFICSAKTGEGIDSLRYFLSKIPPSIARSNVAQGSVVNPAITTKMVVDDKFFSKTVGIILSGTIM